MAAVRSNFAEPVALQYGLHHVHHQHPSTATFVCVLPLAAGSLMYFVFEELKCGAAVTTGDSVYL